MLYSGWIYIRPISQTIPYFVYPNSFTCTHDDFLIGIQNSWSWRFYDRKYLKLPIKVEGSCWIATSTHQWVFSLKPGTLTLLLTLFIYPGLGTSLYMLCFCPILQCTLGNATTVTFTGEWEKTQCLSCQMGVEKSLHLVVRQQPG